jgi:hypothetical protein
VDHEKSVVAVKPGIVAVQAQDTARACEVNFTASYHGPMDFVRRPFSEKNGGVMVPTRANPKTFRIWSPLCQSLLHHESAIDFNVPANWQ